MTQFPKDFAWGTATAAYQIEGAVDEDGRGPSIWDTFCTESGQTINGDTGRIACDHYHRLDEDLDLIADLGVNSYRFSVAWPRVQPDGSGQVNAKGLDFYRRLVDGLRSRGVRPFATLYHWDLPQALQDRGGWVNRDTALRFAEYAGIVGQALGFEVVDYVTVNEPWVSAWLGYGWGDHAPGHTDFGEALAATHHLLLAHGLATKTLRESDPGARVGIALNLSPVRPGSYALPDVRAARLTDGHYNRLFLDPLFGAAYPADVLAEYRDVSDLAFIRPGDLEEIAQPMDFLGVNYYRRSMIVSAHGGPGLLGGVESTPPGVPVTAMNWPVEPAGLTELLLRLAQDYPAVPPILITENGAAFDDYQSPEGLVMDERRIDYLRSHLEATAEAMAQGIDVRGYFVWSMLDNFEWAHGYSKRFGLVYVDYVTQRRVPKSSAAWYRDVISRGGLVQA